MQDVALFPSPVPVVVPLSFVTSPASVLVQQAPQQQTQQPSQEAQQSINAANVM